MEQSVILPCQVGDIVWVLFTPKHPANPAHKGKWFISESTVERFLIGTKGISMQMCPIGTMSVKEIGKTIFFTLEEAETALRERGDGLQRL